MDICVIRNGGVFSACIYMWNSQNIDTPCVVVCHVLKCVYTTFFDFFVGNRFLPVSTKLRQSYILYMYNQIINDVIKRVIFLSR